MKIRPKVSDSFIGPVQVYDAVENFTGGSVKMQEPTTRLLSLKEYIERHNDAAKKPNPSTGLPKPWDEETEERKERLLELRPLLVHDGNYTCIDVPNVVTFNGYFVTFPDGGNMNRGWCKLFSPDSVEVLV